MRCAPIFAAVVIAAIVMPVRADKALMHYLSVPVIEAAGVYSAVSCLRYDRSSRSTQIAAGTSLGLMAAGSTLGALYLWGPEKSRMKIRTIHRIVGVGVCAAALWLSVSASVDELPVAPRIAGYGYTALSVVPIIMFSF